MRTKRRKFDCPFHLTSIVHFCANRNPHGGEKFCLAMSIQPLLLGPDTLAPMKRHVGSTQHAESPLDILQEFASRLVPLQVTWCSMQDCAPQATLGHALCRGSEQNPIKHRLGAHALLEPSENPHRVGQKPTAEGWACHPTPNLAIQIAAAGFPKVPSISSKILSPKLHLVSAHPCGCDGHVMPCTPTSEYL